MTRRMIGGNCDRTVLNAATFLRSLSGSSLRFSIFEISSRAWATLIALWYLPSLEEVSCVSREENEEDALGIRDEQHFVKRLGVLDKLDDTRLVLKREDLVCADREGPSSGAVVALEEPVDEREGLLHDCVLAHVVASLELW